MTTATAAMPVHHESSLAGMRTGFANGEHGGGCRASCTPFIYQRKRIARRHRRFQPGRVDQRRRHGGKLRHPLPDEHPVRVLILRLLDRVIDPDGVDAGDPGLHLALAVMNAGLIVGELARQMQRRPPPVKPQMIGGKAHHHRPHTERQPAGRRKRTHAGIDKRIACLSGPPCRQPRAGIGV